MKYKIIKSTSVDGLASLINEALSDSWTLYGPLVVTTLPTGHPQYMQPMIHETTADIKDTASKTDWR